MIVRVFVAVLLVGAFDTDTLSAQSASRARRDVPLLLSLPESGAHCTIIPDSRETNDPKRRGVRQLFNVETRTPKRTITLGLDGEQRIKLLFVQGTPVLRYSFDTTGRVPTALHGDSVENERARLLALAVRERCAPLPPV